MPFHDLNVLYKQDLTDLAHTLSFHHELGYRTIALSVPVTGKLPPTMPTLPVAEISSQIPTGMQLLTRMTLTISDTAQNHRINALQTSYDILALRPTTEKTLQLCCSSLECDLISLDFSQRLPFVLRFKTVASALQRGIRFEICYSSGVSGGGAAADARRNLISGATSLIRATRGRGVIISSEARNALGIRAPMDVINLAQVWGLSQERGKEAVCEEAERVVKLARLKRSSYRGVVDIVNGGDVVVSPKADPLRNNGDNGAGVGPGKQDKHPKQTPEVSGAKRKASTSSLSGAQPAPSQDASKPLLKREMKRRAKKARLEGGQSAPQNTGSSDFPIQHESLATQTELNA